MSLQVDLVNEERRVRGAAAAATAVVMSPRARQHCATVTQGIPMSASKKTYACPYCSYAASRQDNLTVHMRRHTGERPYACPYCPYTAAQSSTLKAHIRVHNGEKPYSCTQCSYTAAQQSTLMSHIQTHNRNMS